MREHEQADLFYRDLMGIGPRRPAPGVSIARPVPATVPPAPRGPLGAGRLFDAVVHRGLDPNAVLLADEDVGPGRWEVVALPRSLVAAEALPEGALVVERALGDAGLGFLQVLGEDVGIESVYDADGRVRPGVLVLARRPAAAQDVERIFADAAEDRGAADVVEIVEIAVGESSAGETAGEATEEPEQQAHARTRAGFFGSRDAAAPGGRAVMERLKGERGPADWARREDAFVAELSAGNMPDALLRWVDVNLTHQAGTRTITGTVQVLPDYLCIGRDDDFVHVPLDPISAQRVADRFGVMLPTARICHAIYTLAAARNRIGAIQRDYWQRQEARRRSARPGRDSNSTAAYLEHSEAIQARMKAAGLTLGELVAGHKKDVVLARRLHAQPDRIAFQGFYDASGYPFEPCYENPQRQPQPSCRKDAPTLAHERRFADYAQGVRLVHPWMIVDGQRKKVADVLADPVLSPLISSEGTIVPPRIPGAPRPTAALLAAAGVAAAGAAAAGAAAAGPVAASAAAIGAATGPAVSEEPETVSALLDVPEELEQDEEMAVAAPEAATAAPEDAVAAPEDAAPAVQEPAAPEEPSAAEAVPLGGRGRFRHDALGGDGDNVEARFNLDATTAAGTTVDVVVHLHGHGRADAGFLAEKARLAGLDMVDDVGAVRVRSARPTLALVPQGRNRPRSTVWGFEETLPDRVAFDALVAAGLSWLAASVLRLPAGSALARGRLSITAHSGGGASLSALLRRGLDPDEVVCFDSLYGGDDPIARWAERRIGSADAARCGLRAFYLPCGAVSREHPSGHWVRAGRDFVLRGVWPWSYGDGRWRLQSTEVYARRLHHAIERALSGGSGRAALASRFRVERTTVGHNEMPGRYTPLLLDDIAATVPGASAPPPASSRPACVANDDWLTRAPVKPGGDAAPPPRPAATSEAAVLEVEDVYAAPDARSYTPSASAALFRTAPDPVAVSPASQWPERAADADGVVQRALRALGVGDAGIRAHAGAGLAALRPIAGAFGEAALVELLRRVRYTPAQLARPPHSFASDAALARAFGRPVARQAVLAVRTLLAIPGHFRELARRAGTEAEAYALENLGWLLLRSLADDVRTSSGIPFWMPAPPPFVTAFANPLPSVSAQVSRFVTARLLIDTTLSAGDYQSRAEAWRTGPAGRMWRLETGRETVAGRPPGAPFYPEPFTIPASIDISAPRAQVSAAWRRRVADFDAGRTTVPLTQCDSTYLRPLAVMGRISLRGLQLRAQFPSPVSAASLTSLNGLAAVGPAFEAAFQAIADLGWNDLLFETQGMGCFRGKKIPGSATAARNMSEHSLGIAIDVNVFENAQNTNGSMDPRIAALFEAFRFRWGKAFRTPDPMHFEYTG